MIDITSIFVIQKRLNRKEQVPKIMQSIMQGKVVEKIILHTNSEDGQKIYVRDGHHRLAAHYLLGHKILLNHEYVLCEVDYRPQAIYGKIKDLIKWSFI